VLISLEVPADSKDSLFMACSRIVSELGTLVDSMLDSRPAVGRQIHQHSNYRGIIPLLLASWAISIHIKGCSTGWGRLGIAIMHVGHAQNLTYQTQL